MVKQHNHIAAPIAEDLITRAAQLRQRIEKEGASREHIDALYHLVMDMTESGLDFFFLEPLRRLGAGTVMMGMASVGISSTMKGTRMVIHRVLKKMDDRHVVTVLDFIDEVIFPPDQAA